VVVTQAVSGPSGWSTAPCPSQISSQWGFAGGSTAPGNSLTLSLFDPAGVEAVVNVTFITEAGVITPQQYQGLVVPAGQLVDENVGDFVQGRNTIATLVDAQAGGVVASEFQQWSASSSGLSLQAGSPSPSTTWRFAQTTALPQSTVDITLANPGQSPATATIALGLSSGSVVPHRLVVAPSSVAVFSASGTAGLPEQVPYALTVTSTAPIVVGRSVEAPTGSVEPGWGSSSATAAVATHWLVPGPGIPSAPGTANATVDSLAVADPGPSAVRVVVGTLGGSRRVAVFTVDPGRLTVLGAPQVDGLPVLTVSASGPVNVEEDSGPSGAPGVVSSTGFPLAGELRPGPLLALGDGVPPLAPPLGAHQDAQLGMPAVRDLVVRLEVVETVLALLLAGGLPRQYGVRGQVAQFDREGLVDLLRFRVGNHVVGHVCNLPPPNCTVSTRQHP
jgi:hypothetical protein